MLWINRFTEELKGLIFQNGENEVLWFIASLYAFSIRAYGLCWISSFNVNRLVAVSLVFYVFLLGERLQTVEVSNSIDNLNIFRLLCNSKS